jgi:exodeoxyribonuclease VII small subunit
VKALRLFEDGIVHLRSAGAALKTVDARVQQLVEAADGSFSVVDLGG